MIKIFKNPLFWVGAVVGGAWLIKNKPKTKAGRVARSLKKGAKLVLDETGDYAKDLIGSVQSTGQDVWGVFEAGDSDGSIDTAGFDGARNSVELDDAETSAYMNGDGNTGVAGCDIEDTDSMVAPDDEGQEGLNFGGGTETMSFSDYNY